MLLFIVGVWHSEIHLAYAVDWPHVDDFNSILWYDDVVNHSKLSLGYLLRITTLSHPLASQGLITIAVFLLGGVHIKNVILLNALMIAATSAILSAVLLRHLGRSVGVMLGCIALLLVFFHPLQMNHMLWAFELGWFLINLLLVSNAALIESKVKLRLFLVFLLCVVGTFCSAHGAILWLAAALQLALRSIKDTRWWILAFTAGFMANAAYVWTLAPQDVVPLRANELIGYMRYFAQLIGVLFCQHDHSAVLYNGVCLLALAAVLMARSFAGRKGSPVCRITFVLIASSLIFVALFERGRYQWGIDWPLGEFHMASLVIPLYAGVFVGSLQWLVLHRDSAPWRRALISIPCVYLLAGTLSSIHYGREFARESQVRGEIARHYACDPTASDYVIFQRNLGIQYKKGYLRARPLLSHLCAIPDSRRTRATLTYPAYFIRLADEQPEMADALHALWQVYVAHYSLPFSYPPTDVNRGEDLVRFAVDNARAGSTTAPEMLKSYEGVFLRLGQSQ